MLRAEVFLRACAACGLVLGHLALSSFLAARLAPRLPGLARLMAVVAAGMALATAGFHLLAAAGLFTLPAAIAAEALLLGGLLASAQRRAELAAVLRRHARFIARLARRTNRSAQALFVAAFAVAAASLMLRPFVLPPLGWDGLMYHLPKAALWVQQGKLALLEPMVSWRACRNMFAGGEVFTAWAMLPLHGDTLALVGDVVAWAAVGVGTWSFARSLGARDPLAGTAAAFILALPPVRFLVGIGYVDPMLWAALAAALALGARFMRRGEGGSLILAAAALGVAIGVKVTVVPVAGVLALFWLAAARRYLGAGTLSGGSVALAALAGVAFVAPWPVINTLDAGKPLSPLPVAIGGLVLGETNPEFARYLALPARPYDLAAELSALAQTFPLLPGDGVALWLPMALPLVVLLLRLPAVRRGPLRWLPLLLAAAAVGAIYTRPMTYVRQFWPDSAARFWIPVFLAAVPASVIAFDSGPRARVYLLALRVLAVVGLARTFVHWATVEELTAELVVAAAIAAIVLATRQVPGRARAVVALLLASLAITALSAWRDGSRYRLSAMNSVFVWGPERWVSLARALDDPARPRRVAIVAGTDRVPHNLFGYPFFGRRLQNQVVAPGQSETGDARAWLSALQAARITDVVSLAPRTRELGWMEAMPERFERLAGEGSSAAFRVRPEQ